MQKRQYLAAALTSIAVIGTGVALFRAKPVVAQSERSAAVFTADGKLELPTGYRRWVFVGAPLTPNGLNNGHANFPEFHNVYIQAQNVDAYLKTGSFPEGTVIVKELTRVLDPTFPDGSRVEPSGRGFFNGEFNGIDETVKDSKRFSKTNGWGFFTFGHHPLPYDKTAAEQPVTVCAGCHIANVAKTDMTWVQFYPMLRGKSQVSQVRKKEP
jgi:Cytochrome P460